MMDADMPDPPHPSGLRAPSGEIGKLRMHATIDEALRRHEGEPGVLLPVLHDIQDSLGYIPAQAVAHIAERLNLSRAEVHGVITYYSHFRSVPPAPHTVAICRGEACQSMGSAALLAHAERSLGCKLHQASADGQFQLDPVYCLGLCASSPAATLDGTPHARVTPEKLDALIARQREIK
jgi:formate dehydrogenase subunit gamma